MATMPEHYLSRPLSALKPGEGGYVAGYEIFVDEADLSVWLDEDADVMPQQSPDARLFWIEAGDNNTLTLSLRGSSTAFTADRVRHRGRRLVTAIIS